VAEEAARWRLKLEAGVADREALSEWLGRHPSHRSAFQDVEEVWSFFDAARDDPRLARAGREARRHIRARRQRRTIAGFGLAAGLAAGVVVVALPRTDVYQNTAHERRVVRLADGSTVTLDAMSEVVTHFSPLRRSLTLAEGEARFDVAHNAWRPFVVTAGPRSVTAIGTAFDVDLADGTLTVRLLRGRVKVASSDAAEASPEVSLSPGEQLVVSGDAQKVSAFDPAAAAAWAQGRLVFDDIPLSVAVARQNRYTARRIVLSDPGLGELRVSGVFDAGDTAAFADATARVLPLAVGRRPDGTILLSHRQ
jgi:transmembrane sensor